MGIGPSPHRSLGDHPAHRRRAARASPVAARLRHLAGPAPAAPPRGTEYNRTDLDRLPPHPTAGRHPVPHLARAQRRHDGPMPVSYTHLTLPTILRV